MEGKEEKGGEEVKEKLLRDAKSFIERQDLMEDYFHAAYTSYLQGEGVSDTFQKLRERSPKVFRFISVLLGGEEEGVKKLLDDVGMSDKERKLLLKFRERYEELRTPLICESRRQYNVLNHWTGMNVTQRIINQGTGYPQMEFNILSYDKVIMHSREDIDDTLDLAKSLQRSVTDYMKELEGEGVTLPYKLVKSLWEFLHEIKNNAEEAITVIEVVKKEQEKAKEEEKRTEEE